MMLGRRGKIAVAATALLAVLAFPGYFFGKKFWIAHKGKTEWTACQTDFKAGHDKTAFEHCSRALAYNPTLQGPYLVIAQLYRNVGEIDYALSYLERLMKLTRESGEGWLMLGEIAVEQKNYAQAKTFFENAQLIARRDQNADLLTRVEINQKNLALKSR